VASSVQVIVTRAARGLDPDPDAPSCVQLAAARPLVLAYPTGADSNRLIFWLRGMDGLRVALGAGAA
jgi:hypothetical protein